jgi:hypothetical protein
MNASVLLASPVSDFFSDFTPDQRFALVVIGISCLTAVLITVIIAVAASWAAIRERDSRFELTRDLLDQGKTAEEIERIVRPADGFTRSMQHWFGGCGAKR